jgi:sigma-B regulation protein RsbU (phosphoserine phosphatase)
MRPGNRRLYALLALVFVLVMGYQVCISAGIIQYKRLASIEAAWPFQLGYSDRFSNVYPAFAKQGIQPGDELLQVEGQPYRGTAQIAKALDAKRPGDRLNITVLRKGRSEPEMFAAPLDRVGSGELSAVGWISLVGLNIVTPGFCLLLGFFVAAMRPRDPLAWLLLALMLSFAEISMVRDTLPPLFEWPPILREAGIFYSAWFASIWSVSILLFGIYFPERLSLDRRWPWLKWLLIIPIAVVALGDSLTIAAQATDFRLAAALHAVFRPLGYFTIPLRMAAVSSFFFAVGTKIGEASSADARRRLKLLINGTGVALTPLFILVVYALVRGGWDNIADKYWIASTLPLALFPITLAYVIVVQRALDVGVVIRQGLRYALAKRTVRALQIVALTVVNLSVVMLAIDSNRNRTEKIEAIAVGITAGILITRGSEKLRGWVDRRFFREAYNAEKILRDLSDQVRTMVETGPLLETVANQISSSMHVPRVAMLVKANSHYGLAYALGLAAGADIAFDAGAGTVEQLKRNREPQRVYTDNPDSWIYRQPSVTAAEREQLQKLETQLLLPLAFKEKLIGFMSLSAKRSEEPYSSSDVQLLESVAMQTGLALENSHLTEAIASEVAQRERLNRELEIAREVQERLFPQNYPAVAGIDYAGRCRPALGVGGDYYDFLELADGQLGIAIGDVSGKGVPAALLMASLQASLRGQTISGSDDLAKLMTNMNRLIFDTSPANRYATFFYGQYQPSTRQFAFVNGGHNPPMIFRKNEVLRLEDGGPVVGLFKAARYSQASVELAAGDVLLFYTDGISEAMNSSDEEWGEERMIDAVRACQCRPAQEMIGELMEAADAFVAGAPQHDDMTIVVVKLVGQVSDLPANEPEARV